MEFVCEIKRALVEFNHGYPFRGEVPKVVCVYDMEHDLKYRMDSPANYGITFTIRFMPDCFPAWLQNGSENDKLAYVKIPGQILHVTIMAEKWLAAEPCDTNKVYITKFASYYRARNEYRSEFENIAKRSENNMKNMKKNIPEIKNVIIAAPYTTIIWSDKTKTQVKCMDTDNFDPEHGFAMAVLKKIYEQPDKPNAYSKWVKGWVKKGLEAGEKQKKKKSKKKAAPVEDDGCSACDCTQYYREE